MTSLRLLVMQNRRLAVWLVLVALCVKMLVPAGFMPTVGANGTMTVSICTGTGPQTVVITMPGMGAHDVAGGGDGMSDHAKAQMPCAFSGLGLATLAAVDPVMLAIAIAFVLATGFAAVPLLPHAAPAHLWPPLRGPPVAA